MRKKADLLKECVKIMQKASVEKWYKENLETKPQVETIQTLLTGINSQLLSVEEALSIALVVGVQWDTKFEGVQ